MPFLLLDDATQEAQRRLQDFGAQQLQQLNQANQPPLQNVSASDITGRLQDFGSQQLQQLQQLNQPPFPGALGTTPGAPPPVPGVQLPTPPQQLQQLNQPPLQQLQPQGLTDITNRLQDFGSQQLQGAQQNVVQQLEPLNQPPFQPVSQPFQQQPTAGGDLQDYARQVANKYGIDPDIFTRQIQQESGFNPSARSGAGAIGVAQFMPGTAQGMGIDPTDPYAALDAAARMDAQNLAKYGGDYAKMLAAYNAGGGNVDKYGGVPPFAETQTYVQNILGGAKQAVQQTAQNVVQATGQTLGGALPAISQFGDKQLSAAEAYAACGPAAAVRFAQMFGRQPTLREAVDLASQVGWTPGGGMAGLGSESQLFDKMGIPHREVGANWNALAREASSGNPVTISTPGHYFTADGYDASSGAFHVGSSGTDLRGGSEWMTPQQMEARMGALQGGLAVDNPQVPGASPLANPGDAIQQAASSVGQKAQSAWQLLNTGVSDATQGFMSPLASAFERARQSIDPNDPATQDFMQQHPDVMKALNLGPEQQTTDWTDPHAIAALGVDPLGALQRGGADILGGIQTGDIGRGLGGVFEAGGGLLSALPGGSELGPGVKVAPEAVQAGETALRNALDQVSSQHPDEVAAPLRQAAEDLRGQTSAQDIADTIKGWLSGRQPTGPVADALSARMQARINPMYAARLGLTALGGAAGFATTPEDASMQERALRTAAGATAAAVAPSLASRAILDNAGRVIQATRIGSLAGGIPTLGHIALNTPVQFALKLASDVPASVLTGHPEATAAELYGALQGLRSWGLNAAQTLAKPGPLAESLGGGLGPQALDTGLTGLVRAHPLLQDVARQMTTHMDLWKNAADAATNAGFARLSPEWRAEVARLVGDPTADMTRSATAAGNTAGLQGPMGTTGQAIADLLQKSPIARFFAPIYNIGYQVATRGVEMTPLGWLGTAADVGRAALGIKGPYSQVEVAQPLLDRLAGAQQAYDAATSVKDVSAAYDRLNAAKQAVDDARAALPPGGFAGRGAAGAVTPLAERVRRNLIGLALMYEGYNQAANGLITGEGPADPQEQATLRQTGWQPDSAVLGRNPDGTGGRYFDLHLLGPVGWPLVAGANAYEAHNGPGGAGLKPVQTPQGEAPPGLLEQLGDFVAREGRYFNNETFLRSVGSALNLIGSSAQQGQVPARETASLLESMIPQGALLANLASVQDPYQRVTQAQQPQDVLANALASRLPGQRETLMPRLTATGQPEPNPQAGLGLLLPRSSVVTDDPILRQMQTLGITPVGAPKTVPFGPLNDVALTPAEQQTWQQYRGQQLQKTASTLINSAAYQKMSEPNQRNALAKLASTAASTADKLLIKDIGTQSARARMVATGKAAPVYGYAPGGTVSTSLSEQLAGAGVQR